MTGASISSARLALAACLLLAACGGATPATPGSTDGAARADAQLGQVVDAPATAAQDLGAPLAQTPPYLYVTDKIARKLVFEIDAVTGRTANPQALAKLVERLSALGGSGHLRKPEGVTTMLDDQLPAHPTANHAYSFAELDALVTKHRELRSEGTIAAAYILYVDGHYAEDPPGSKVLGFAYGGDRIVMFKDSIAASCDSPLPLLRDRVCMLAEASVLVHEFGHLMGLVNNGLAMAADHQDEAHGAHDDDKGCIMYWTVNSSDHVTVLKDYVGAGGDAVAAFDPACLADLAAAQRP